MVKTFLVEKNKDFNRKSIVLNREILIFDKTTSALDRKTENTLIRSLKNKEKSYNYNDKS